MTGLWKVAVKFFAFAAVAVMLLVLLVNTMLNGAPGGSQTYHADFTDVSGLRVGDDVKVAGVRVGRVQGIKVIDDGTCQAREGGKQACAQVDFAMAKSQPLLDNTTMVMRYQNLVGQRYLALVQPAQHGARLHPGATIPVSRTDQGFDLTELLNGFRPLFQVLNPADVNKLANSIVQVLQGEGPTVATLLSQTGQLTSFVANRDQVIGAVLTNLTPVLTNLSGHGTELTTTIDALRQLMAGLAADRQQIGTSIDGVSKLIGSTSSLLDRTRDPLVGAVKQFRAVAAMLQNSEQQFDAALTGLTAVFAGLGRATAYQNAANIYICRLKLNLGTGPIPVGGNPTSGVCKG